MQSWRAHASIRISAALKRFKGVAPFAIRLAARANCHLALASQTAFCCSTWRHSAGYMIIISHSQMDNRLVINVIIIGTAAASASQQSRPLVPLALLCVIPSSMCA